MLSAPSPAQAILLDLRKDKRNDLLKFCHEQRRDVRHEHSIWQDIQPRIFFRLSFYLRRWSISVATPDPSIGDLLGIGRITNIGARVFIIMKFAESSR